MYKISSLEAGTRFKFYGHTYTLGAVEWTVVSSIAKANSSILTSGGVPLPCDLLSCVGDDGRQYWVPTSYEVEVIEPVKSKLADLSMANKIERMERALEGNKQHIDNLYTHANSLNLTGICTDIINLQNAIKKIEADKASFDVVAEIRKLQNQCKIHTDKISFLKDIININEAQNTKIFSEISARLDKLDGLYPTGNSPKPEYAPGKPPVPQIGWRKIDPDNLPIDVVVAINKKGVHNCIDEGVLKVVSGKVRLCIRRHKEHGNVFYDKNYTHYFIKSEFANLPEID
jgi:hypothetical protein